MAPNYTQYPNPIELRTRKAARVLGKLISLWTTDPATRPADAKPDATGRMLVMGAESFRALMHGGIDGLTLDDGDFTLRDDVTEVELILRTPGRASLLLPEPEAIAEQEATRGGGGLLPGLKMTVLPSGLPGAEAWASVGGTSDQATNQTKIEGFEALDQFLYPFMAGYMCSQCT